MNRPTPALRSIPGFDRLFLPVVLATLAAGVCTPLPCPAADATPPASAAPAAAPATSLASPPPKDSVVLWNGRDLTGWKIFLNDPAVEPRTIWSVTDGVLHLVGKPNGYLHTEQTFSNYRLHVEWRWPAGADPRSNSGVFVHVGGPDAIWPPGVECQLQAGNAGQLVGTGVDLPGAPVSNKKPRAPKLAAASEKPFGEWNTYDIICRGDIIEVSVNGVRQNHVEKVSVKSGGIGLQMEGYPVDFRNLWLQPLPAADPEKTPN